VAFWDLPSGDVIVAYSESLAPLNRGMALANTAIKAGTAWWREHSRGLISWHSEVLQ
jgi:hypothetical protein